MSKFHPRTEPVNATQCTEPFVLERRSGRQHVYPGEWVVQRLDSAEPEHWMDEEFRKAFTATHGDGK
jgi:hypothetical protein